MNYLFVFFKETISFVLGTAVPAVRCVIRHRPKVPVHRHRDPLVAPQSARMP